MARGLVQRTRSKSAERSMGTTRLPPTAFTAGADSAGSDRQSLAALGAPRIDHRPAAPALHANEKPVRARTPDLGSLISAFHDGSPEEVFDGLRRRDACGPKIDCLNLAAGAERLPGNPRLDQRAGAPSTQAGKDRPQPLGARCGDNCG